MQYFARVTIPRFPKNKLQKSINEQIVHVYHHRLFTAEQVEEAKGIISAAVNHHNSTQGRCTPARVSHFGLQHDDGIKFDFHVGTEGAFLEVVFYKVTNPAV